jgi:hypothetical protein
MAARSISTPFRTRPGSIRSPNAEANIETVTRMLALVDRIAADNRLGASLEARSAMTGQRIVQSLLLGGEPS